MRTRIAADIGTPATSTGLASCSEAAIRGWWGTDAVEPQGKGTPMLRVHGILGNATDPGVAERLHRLEHDGRVEYVVLSRADTQRKRLRAATDRGTDIAIALPRSARLENGSVLLLSDEHAVVVRLEETPWLEVEPADDAAALELGYLAGNHHWRVKFAGARLRIALDGPAEDYVRRLASYLEEGRARLVERD
ncbi:MAG TPA: urease accessory protein UreE [Dongiaceae bacterium]|nr:urease accessory protein UreE [Dongiaceae bacterium]